MTTTEAQYLMAEHKGPVRRKALMMAARYEAQAASMAVSDAVALIDD